MKRFYNIIAATGITALMFVSGCIKENLEPCPEEGQTTVNLRAETFGKENNGPVSEFEPVFGKRIGSIRYSLYQNGTLIWEKEAGNLSGVSSSAYGLNLGHLDMGEYNLLVSANAPASHYENTAASPEKYSIKYQGLGQTQDYFSAVIPLIVDCDCDLTFDGILRRLHTVVQTTLYDVPAHIAAAEITIDNLSERKNLYGNYYDGTIGTSLKKEMNGSQRDEVVMVMGTFPTAGNDQPSHYSLKLFDINGTTVYDKVVTATLRLKRNTLTDITVRFPENPAGDVTYEINMDTSWDGQTNGGSTELE